MPPRELRKSKHRHSFLGLFSVRGGRWERREAQGQGGEARGPEDPLGCLWSMRAHVPLRWAPRCAGLSLRLCFLSPRPQEEGPRLRDRALGEEVASMTLPLGLPGLPVPHPDVAAWQGSAPCPHGGLYSLHPQRSRQPNTSSPVGPASGEVTWTHKLVRDCHYQRCGGSREAGIFCGLQNAPT